MSGWCHKSRSQQGEFVSSFKFNPALRCLLVAIALPWIPANSLHVESIQILKTKSNAVIWTLIFLWQHGCFDQSCFTVCVKQDWSKHYCSHVKMLLLISRGYVSAVLQRYLAWFNPASTIPFATIYSNDSVTDLKAMLRMIPHPLTHIFCKSIKSTLICLNRSSKPCLKQWVEVIDPRFEIWFVRYSPKLWKRLFKI